MSLGAPIPRLDGPFKVCGAARYAAEFAPPGLLHALAVTSTIARGRIADIDTAEAERAPGVVLVLTHRNAMRLPNHGKPPPGARVLTLLQDDRVHYNHQPVAVVVARSFEQARAAQALVRVRYEQEAPQLDFASARAHAHSPGKIQDQDADSQRGDPQQAAAGAAHRIERDYATPMQHHNPMEPHATLAEWQGEQLTLHDSTQYVAGVQKALAGFFGLQPGQVRVRCPYTGGGFGGKGAAWSHVVLAAMAARQAGQPVRLVMQRPQLFGPVGGRPRTEQRLKLAADRDGKLLALEHHAVSNTSAIEDWTESCALSTRSLYACQHLATSHRLATLNVGSPTFQRAPGEATGSFALESALDELAHEAGIDPLELRLRNYAERDPERDRPFSSKELRECYRVGAERIGWARRNPQPGSMQQGRWRIGYGMATAVRPAKSLPAQARVQLDADGRVLVQSSTEDLGTGTYTVMAQIAADALGWPLQQVRFELGDTLLPEAPISAGSMTVQSVGSAVHAACVDVRTQLVRLACADAQSPLHGAAAGEVRVVDGWLEHAGQPQRREPAAAVLARHGRPLEATGKRGGPADTDQRYTTQAFGAVFVEVHVDRDLGLLRVPRVVGAYGVGQVINAKTAHSQLMGGIVWGLSSALMEESFLDVRNGRYVNNNLAEYHVPVNADIGEIDIVIVPEHDPHVNAMGAKGLGEVSMVGVSAAVANAVFHATGKRIRELPLTLDKLL